MNLVIPEIDDILSTSAEKISTLVVEHKGFFRKIHSGLVRQAEGIEGDILLIGKNDTPLEIAHWVDIIDNPLTFRINDRPLLTKICNVLERESMAPENLLDTESLLQSIELMLDKCSFRYPGTLQYTKLTVGSIIKAVGLEVQDEYDNPIERLLDYMELVREFDRSRLFVFINFRSWFTDEETEAFFGEILRNQFHTVFLESQDRERLELERRVTVDSDLCEF